MWNHESNIQIIPESWNKVLVILFPFFSLHFLLRVILLMRYYLLRLSKFLRLCSKSFSSSFFLWLKNMILLSWASCFCQIFCHLFHLITFTLMTISKSFQTYSLNSIFLTIKSILFWIMKFNLIRQISNYFMFYTWKSITNWIFIFF